MHHWRYINMEGERKQARNSIKRRIIREQGLFIPALHEKYLKEPRRL